MLSRLILSLAQPDPSATLAKLRETPALQAVLNGAEPGEVLSVNGISQGSWAFLAALLAHFTKGRPVVVVCPTGQLQEQLQQELETWLLALGKRLAKPPLFFPAWDVLPHEARLPHADVLSERLETLIHLAKRRKPSPNSTTPGPVIVTTAVALLQRTFSPAELKNRFRSFKLGQRIDPLDLVEWLEDQGYEPEAQVSHKGELALRGGILDIFPLVAAFQLPYIEHCCVHQHSIHVHTHNKQTCNSAHTRTSEKHNTSLCHTCYLHPDWEVDVTLIFLSF